MKVTGGILHVRNRPLRDLYRQWQAVRIAVVEKGQSIDCLRAALNVERQGFAVVVSRGSIRQKESLLPVLVSTRQFLVEAVISRALLVTLKAIQNVRCVEVVNPVRIGRLGIVPGCIRPLVLSRVLHRLRRQLSVGFISGVGISTGEQTPTKGVGVVNLSVFDRDVANANPISIAQSAEVVDNVLARTHGDVQVPLFVEMIVGVQEGVPNQGGPHHSGDVFGQIEASRLIVEMIAPACSAVARQSVIDQPLQGKLRLARPDRVACRFVKAHETSRKEAHAFAGMFFSDSQQWTQIHREPSYALQKNCPQKFGLERKRTDKSGIEPVECVVPAIVILFEPVVELLDGPVDRSL